MAIVDISRPGASGPSRVMLAAAALSTSRDSDVHNVLGWKNFWLEIVAANFAAGTDFVGYFEFWHALTGSAFADLGKMKIDETMLGVTLPTGLTVDTTNDRLTYAATYLANGKMLLCFNDVSPLLAVRFVSTSVGTPGTATLGVNVYPF
jgi:hypothetical protein